MIFKSYKTIFSKTSAVFLLFIMGGFLLYSNTFSNEFIWDDYESIVHNKYIKDWKYFPKYFTESLVAGAGLENNYWRPLVLVSFALDYKLGQLDVFWYHLQNLFWHILATSLLYVFLRKVSLTKVKSFLVAVLFLIHPLQTEAVTYISGRADMMFMAFLFLSLINVVNYIKCTANNKKFFYYLLANSSFLLALLSKERGIMLLPVLALYLFLLVDKRQLSFLKKVYLISSFVLLGGVYVLLRSTTLHFISNFNAGIVDNINFQLLNIYQQLLVYLKMVGVCGGLIFLPIKLHMVRVFTLPQSFFDPYVLIGTGLLGGAIFYVYRFWKINRLYTFFVFWILVMLFPSFYTFRMQGYMGEHWMYAVLPGILVLIVGGSTWVFKRICHNNRGCKILSVIFFGLIMIVWVSQAMQRNDEWSNPIDFYTINIKRGGASAMIYNNLGMAYANQNEYPKALSSYNKAISLNENIYEPWYNKGNVYLALKQLDKAIRMYKKSLEYNENFLPIYHNLFLAYLENDEEDKSLFLLRKAEKKFPNSIVVKYDLALFNYKKGDFIQAQKYVQDILTIDPNNFLAKKFLKEIETN